MMTEWDVEGTVNIGDIFECSWGYDQTNIDYYQVVAVSKTGRAKLHPIRSGLIETRGQQDIVGPLVDEFKGEPTGYKIPSFSRRTTRDTVTESCWIRINSYSSASRVNPDSTAYKTGVYFGH